jgi:predicted nucleic acid-binding protein
LATYLLDTSALLCLRDDEPGAGRVAELLEAGLAGKSACLGCFVTLMEIYYRVWKDEGKAAGFRAYTQALQLPVRWLHESPALLERAAAVKAMHAVSLADAWIAAAALEHGAVLVHKDPEFRSVAGLEQEVLPLRARRRR